MTSIEWLLEQVEHNISKTIIEQAKQMRKQEIVNTYIIADSESTQEDAEHNAEKYYEREFTSKGSTECPFFISLTKTTSPSICSVCGKEKYLHKF